MKCCTGWGRQALPIVLMAIAFLVLPFPSVAQSPNRGGEFPVLILVRHADKAAEPQDDPPLTAAGEKRAQDLAATLRNAGVTAIITTQLRRTRETAQPLATTLGLKPEVITVAKGALVSDPAAHPELVQEATAQRRAYIKELDAVVRRFSGGTVLVVGHDWSVPGLIASLGGPQLPDICGSVYDNLFVLTFAGGKTNLIQVHYGAPTPGTNCK
jgi:broad specificity phosphatase PhoE